MLPTELEFAFGMLGVWWPTQDEDGLRQCAAAYRACATTLTTEVIPTAHGAVRHAAANNAGDGIDAAGAFWAEYHRDGDDDTHLDSLATTLHALAHGHDMAADLVEIFKKFLIAVAGAVAALLAAAVVVGGLAALDIFNLRAVAQRAMIIFRREIERFFGESLLRGVEPPLRRILGARGPKRHLAENASMDSPRGAHPLKGLWLTRRSVAGEGIDPFKSVVDQADRREAERIIAAAGKTFDGDYLEYRRRIEEWLRTEGRNRGQELDGVSSPLYFRLYPEPAGAAEGRIVINIPAESVPSEKLTITLEDSFHNYEHLDPDRECKIPDPPVPRVLDPGEMRSIIDTDGFPGHFDGRSDQRYIEVQVWSRDVPAFERVKTLLADAEQREVVTVEPDAPE
ncbi:WXG100-like domain-containing protein [Streptosporangium sp. NBC_01756]|uniref:WXG100-like domain-containing protein n=1 Tax=Streptosporangium sp. NBC_01756 TaxID=2975950 RepID=UPI003FA35BCC